VTAERRGAYRGRIDLAIVTTAKYFVPMLLVRFRKKFPKIEIGLRVHNREAILQLLVRNEVDLIMMGRVPDEIECIAAPFATNPLGIVCAPGHPLSRRRNIDLRTLKDQEFVVRETGSGTRLKTKRLSPAAAEFERFLLEEGGALVDAWS
jgi:LysR family transcriptional regulator, low CO2-responsive transcriptional regulator